MKCNPYVGNLPSELTMKGGHAINQITQAQTLFKLKLKKPIQKLLNLIFDWET